MAAIDQIDRDILRIIQDDAGISTELLAERVNLSKNACWRRVRNLERNGIVAKRVALLNAKAVGLAMSVFVSVKVKEHSPEWLDKFQAAVALLPQITGAFRTSGDVDYMLQVRVADVEAYDAFYKSLIRLAPGMDVSATFVMEEIKSSTALPV